jgi:ankyrin repeat protein
MLYKRLLETGATPDNCWWAIAWYDDIEAAELWLRSGAVIDRNPSPDQLFVGAFQWRRYAFAKWLLGHGVDVNAADNALGLSALMLAVKRKDEDAIRWLIDAGADPERKHQDGMSARELASVRDPNG